MDEPARLLPLVLRVFTTRRSSGGTRQPPRPYPRQRKRRYPHEDLGAVASFASAARGKFRGGWSLGLWGEHDPDGQWHDQRFHPRLLMRPLDGRRTVYSWGALRLDDQDDLGVGGRFVDLRTMSLALTGESQSLESACRSFGDPYEKADVTYGELNDEMFAYALEDVRHTTTLYRNAVAEAARHQGIDLQPHRLYSPASVSASYFEAMGLARPLEQFTDLTAAELGWIGKERDADLSPATPVDRRILGRAMSAFFGARADARFVREPLPVAVLDAVSEYASIDGLLGTWRLLSAERIETVDTTTAVRSMLSDPHLEQRCMARSFWRDEIGCTLVEIENPDGAILPARSRWNPTAADPGIGVNPLTYRGRLWYMLPDTIAATLAGAQLRVTRAIRLVGIGMQSSLRPVRFRGDLLIDPTVDDPFIAMVEARQRVLRDPALPEEERKRREQSLKITVNSAAYGVLARFDRHELPKPIELLVYGPDDEPIPRSTPSPEDPGPYCWPPAAANITAAARLLLMLLEQRVAARGGTYVYVDTDSMAIVATPEGGTIEAAGETHRALSWAQVADIVAEFDGLNPYDPTLVPHLWKVEHDSRTEPLYCYAVSAKRYVLFRVDADGRPRMAWPADEDEDDASDGIEDSLTDWSEHGLGVYLDPSTGIDGTVRRDAKGRRRWIREAWEWVLARELGLGCAEPGWFDRYALTQFSIARPLQLPWFAGRDEALPPAERMRPGSFGLVAQVHGFLSNLSERRHPAAPYERVSEHWAELHWYDRISGKPIRLTTADPALEPDQFVADYERAAVRVKSMRDVLGSYARRPEFKSLAPNGALTDGATHGLLRRRPIESLPVLTTLSGKEGNKLHERAAARSPSKALPPTASISAAESTGGSSCSCLWPVGWARHAWLRRSAFIGGLLSERWQGRCARRTAGCPRGPHGWRD